MRRIARIWLSPFRDIQSDICNRESSVILHLVSFGDILSRLLPVRMRHVRQMTGMQPYACNGI